MNLILKIRGQLETVLEQSDDLEAPEVILRPTYCQACLIDHLLLFEHIGMHDDGEIYEIRGIGI